MAVSGQISEQAFPIYKITEMAVRRATANPAASITAETAQVARDQLYLMQSAWATLGVNLWCQEKLVLGLYPNEPTLTLPVGTMDVLNANWRTTNRPTGTYTTDAGGVADYAFDSDVDTICTQTSTLGSLTVDYGDDTIITTIGYLPGATGTVTPVYEVSADGTTWETILAPGSTAFVDGVWVWEDVAAPTYARYIRCRAAAGTLVVRELYFGNNPSEIPMARMNRDDYVNMPNKAFSGNVLQYWLDRQRVQPVMWLWPVSNSTYNQLVVWRYRYIMDPGTAQNDADVPQRWLDAVVKGLAERMHMELPGFDANRYQILKLQADQALMQVSGGETDNSPMNLAPIISAYTR